MKKSLLINLELMIYQLMNKQIHEIFLFELWWDEFWSENFISIGIKFQDIFSNYFSTLKGLEILKYLGKLKVLHYFAMYIM